MLSPRHSLPIPSHLAMRRRLKSLSSGHQQHQRIAENTLRRYEGGLARAIKSAKNDFIAECAAAYSSHRERDFHGQLIAHRVAVKMLLDQQAQKVIPTFARATLAHVRQGAKAGQALEHKAIGDDSVFSRLTSQWLTQRKDMASTISQTTLNDVLNAVQSGLDDGEGTDEIARAISGVTSFSPYRSTTVARTETHAAALFAQIESGRQAESDLDIELVKTWLPTLDDRTRDAHAEMSDYGAIPLDEKFIVGGEEMDRPGDPSASAGLTVNCRCTIYLGPRGSNS